MRNRFLPFAGSILVVGAALAGCRVIDGGGQGSESASPSTSAEVSQGAAPTAPTDAPDETPLATAGTDYPY